MTKFIGKQVNVPLFEVIEGPTIKLTDIQKRKFNIIDRDIILRKNNDIIAEISYSGTSYKIYSNNYDVAFELFKLGMKLENDEGRVFGFIKFLMKNNKLEAESFENEIREQVLEIIDIVKTLINKFPTLKAFL